MKPWNELSADEKIELLRNESAYIQDRISFNVSIVLLAVVLAVMAFFDRHFLTFIFLLVILGHLYYKGVSVKNSKDFYDSEVKRIRANELQEVK